MGNAEKMHGKRNGRAETAMNATETAKGAREGADAGNGGPRGDWKRNAAGRASVLARKPSLGGGRPMVRVSFRLYGPPGPRMEEGGGNDIVFEHDGGEDLRDETFDIVSAIFERRFAFDRLADEGDSAKTAQDAFFEVLDRVAGKMPAEFPDRPSRYSAALEKGESHRRTAACLGTATPYGIDVRTYFGAPKARGGHA